MAYLANTGLSRKTRLTPAVADGVSVPVASDAYGRQQVVGPNITVVSSNGTAITTATNTSIVAAPGAGSHLRVYFLYCQNTSTTVTKVGWSEGSGGTIKYEPSLAQYQQFGHDINGAWDLPTNTALFINTSAAGNVYYTAEYETVAD